MRYRNIDLIFDNYSHHCPLPLKQQPYPYYCSERLEWKLQTERTLKYANARLLFM